jgi:hypothetical protein
MLVLLFRMFDFYFVYSVLLGCRFRFIVFLCAVFVFLVSVYCHRVETQLQLINLPVYRSRTNTSLAILQVNKERNLFLIQ